ncbi:MAG: hypothetical protein ACM3MK_02570 [Chitinophagales bacterium]
MVLKSIAHLKFREGDLVTVSSLDDRLHFCIIGFKTNDRGENIAILKGLFNDTFIIEKPVVELNSLLLQGKL